MSKYQPLSDHLSAHRGDEWRASFAEIEEVLGFPLPKSARLHRAWWGNENQTDKPHKRAWLGPGWLTGDLDQAGEQVTFRRAAQGAYPPLETPGSKFKKAAPIVAGVALAAGVAALVARKVRRRNAEALKSSGPS